MAKIVFGIALIGLAGFMLAVAMPKHDDVIPKVFVRGHLVHLYATMIALAFGMGAGFIVFGIATG